MSCSHHWDIATRGADFHQIGMCRKCGGERDFGVDPTIVTDKWIITTDYKFNPFTARLQEYQHIEEREYRYPQPPSGFCIPFEYSMDDDNCDDQSFWDRVVEES